MIDDPEIAVGQAIRAAYAAFDDLMVLANQAETRQLICDEKIALGKLLTRVQTLCSFALAVKPAPLLVRNGGHYAAS